MTHFILGSQSPRRREILSYFNLPFKQVASTFDEESHPFKGVPIAYVTELSKGKAEDLGKKYPQASILTADTIVYKKGRVYGKPKNFDDACNILSELQGDWHSVYTALCLKRGSRYYDQVEETRVLFNPLTRREIETYLSTIQWTDKAGGYAIQMPGGLIVKKIDGCYYNVMGMPVNTLRSLFIHIGIDLWDRLGTTLS